MARLFIKQKSCRILKYMMIMGFFVTSKSVMGFSPPSDTLSTGYTRSLNTETWKESFACHHQITPRYTLDIVERGASSRLRLSGQADKWKDELFLKMRFSRYLVKYFKFGVQGQSYSYSDKQSGYLNDAKTYNVDLKGEFLSKRIRIPVSLGYMEDRRFHKIDRGTSWKIGVQGSNLVWNEYENHLNFYSQEDDLGRRKNNGLKVDYHVNRSFYPGTSDSLTLSFQHQRRDYYISPLGEIESRVEKNHRAANSLTYQFNPSFQMDINGSISTRNLKIHQIDNTEKSLIRERKDFQTTAHMVFHYKKRSFQSRISMDVESQEQRYQMPELGGTSSISSSTYWIAPSNSSTLTQIAWITGWKFQPRDSLIVLAHVQNFKYDTPSSNNFDDRDELRYRLDIREIHTFSPSLYMDVSLNLFLHHRVYIFGEKSANNNWTRIIRLSPKLTWHPSPTWQLQQSVEVLANYIDYDFESLFTTVRSYLYRKFMVTENIRGHISENIALRILYKLELDENGKFLWDKWLEQKVADRQNHTATVGLDYKLVKGLTISPGFSWFSRKSYQHTTHPFLSSNRELHLSFESYGPILTLQYNSNRMQFYFSANTLATKTRNREKQILHRINLQMNWNI